MDRRDWSSEWVKRVVRVCAGSQQVLDLKDFPWVCAAAAQRRNNCKTWQVNQYQLIRRSQVKTHIDFPCRLPTGQASQQWGERERSVLSFLSNRWNKTVAEVSALPDQNVTACHVGRPLQYMNMEMCPTLMVHTTLFRFDWRQISRLYKEALTHALFWDADLLLWCCLCSPGIQESRLLSHLSVHDSCQIC